MSSMEIILTHKTSGFCVPISTTAVAPPDSIWKRLNDVSQPVGRDSSIDEGFGESQAVGGDRGASEEPSRAISSSKASKNTTVDSQAIDGDRGASD